MPSRKCPYCATLVGLADEKCPSCGVALSETERSFLHSTQWLDSPAVADDEEDQPDIIGRYYIQQILGRGAFGVVYLAQDPVVNRPVALKMPRRNRFQSSGDVERFFEEARAAGNLKRPSLVAVYDVTSGQIPGIRSVGDLVVS